MTNNEKNAKKLADAIRQFSKHPERLENFQWYLEKHFNKWMQKWAADPEGLATEFINFSEMEV